MPLKAIAALLSALAVLSWPSVVASATMRNTPTRTTTFGVSVKGLPTNLGPLGSFETLVGRPVDVANYYVDFTTPNFDAAAATAMADHGATPMITWQPMNGNLANPVTQPGYQLADIIDGSWDSLLATWAKGIAAWGRPIMLRFGHEMNGNWYPWAEGVNGNTAGQYVQAWRHVHRLFAANGATNVTWVWSPNADYPGSTSLSELYPGDAYVDDIGLDGYNWGTSQSWSAWQTPQQVFGPTLADLRTITHKPIVLTEVSSAEAGGNKATWINQFFSWLEATPAVTGFIWFEFNKEADWRVESSAASRAAFVADLESL